ncbi:MAG: hypothetical protein HY258_00515 [Chloroflexi bacterium]|nr:hypothetical protein [Chloroflexota bacterium]
MFFNIAANSFAETFLYDPPGALTVSPVTGFGWQAADIKVINARQRMDNFFIFSLVDI